MTIEKLNNTHHKLLYLTHEFKILWQSHFLAQIRSYTSSKISSEPSRGVSIMLRSSASSGSSIVNQFKKLYLFTRLYEQAIEKLRSLRLVNPEHILIAVANCMYLPIINQIYAIYIRKRASDISSKHHSKALKDANGAAISVRWLELVRGSPPLLGGGGGRTYISHNG